MKARLIVTGKTQAAWIAQGMDEYTRRLARYINFEVTEIPDHKNRGKIDNESLKRHEGEQLLRRVEGNDILCLLDERGRPRTSAQFADFVQRSLLASGRRAVFAIGGAYGFSDEVYRRADHLVGLSPMTFSHQMARVIFAEQLYRAFTILNNEPYHHA